MLTTLFIPKISIQVSYPEKLASKKKIEIQINAITNNFYNPFTRVVGFRVQTTDLYSDSLSRIARCRRITPGYTPAAHESEFNYKHFDYYESSLQMC